MTEKNNRDPRHIRIFDTTLRYGFQSPGVNVGPEDRFKVAEVLAKLNVDVIEAGFPMSNQENFESVRAIALGIDGPVICAFARAKGEDIDRAWEAIEPAKERGGARIHTFIATSPIHMQADGNTQQQVIAKTREAVKRARKYTPDVEFSLEDATRTNYRFMKRVVLEAVDAGATTINIQDTVGWAVPGEYSRLIKTAKRWIDQSVGASSVVISAHCHNTLGMATANTLLAVRSGARQVEVAINGIGENSGLAPLEGVVANLLYRPDDIVDGLTLSTQVNHEFIFEASELVERVTGLFVAPNHAIVGRNTIERNSGGIYSATIKENINAVIAANASLHRTRT